MNIIQKVITLEDKNEPLSIVPMSDIHYGNIACDVKYLKDTINYIKDTPNCYTMILGDVCDAVLTNDKRFDAETIAPELRGRISNLAFAEYEDMKELLLPIKDKIIVGLTGNHGETLRTKHMVDFDGWLYKELGVPFGGYSSFVIIKMDREQFHCENLTFFVHHGFMSSRKSGAKVNMMDDLTGYVDADIYLTAHSHDLFVKSKQKISVAGNKIKEKKIYLGQTGSFLKSFVPNVTTYSERAMYPPQKIGCLKFKLYPSNNGIDIHCSE